MQSGEMRRKSQQLRRGLGILAVMAMVLAACGNGAADGDGSTDGDGAADDDAEAVASADYELVLVANQESQSMQAQTAYKEVNNPGIRNVFEPLIAKDPETGELLPALATDWERVDGRTLELSIREGVTFHDGSPLNAEAAAFSTNWNWSEDNGFAIREVMGPQISAEAVDEFTLHVTTAETDPLLEERLVASVIQSMQQLTEQPETADTEAVGTGPYRFVEWVPGSHWTGERNDDWWGLGQDHYGAGDAIPAFDTIRVLFRTEDAVRGAMSEAGEAQVAMFVTPEQCENADADDDRRCIVQASDTYIMMRVDNMEGGHPYLQDLRVREAMFLAVDEQSIAENVIVFAEPPQGQPFTEAVFGFNPDLESIGYDPDRAVELLEEAAADGVDVSEITLLVANRQGAAPRIAEINQAVGAYLAAVGFDVEIRDEEHSIFTERALAKPSPGDDRTFVMVHPNQNPLMDMSVPFGAGAISTGNITVTQDPEIDRLFNESFELMGDEREAVLRELAAYNQENFILHSLSTLSFAWVIPADWDLAIDPTQKLLVLNLTTDL